jgi:tRNA-modifying protein YgfZ
MSGAFVVDRSPRGLVVVTGPDATSFLQSLVSQDLDPIAEGSSAHSLLLTPQGKLDVDFRITHVAVDEWWLDCDAEYGPRLATSLTKFRIRVKAEIEDRTGETGMLSFVGTDAIPETQALRSIPTTWDTVDGVDLIGPIDDVRAQLAALDSSLERLTPEAFEVFRIDVGVPKLGVDMDEKTIPQEALLDRDAVSFTKGCFLGQELVTRIDTRGHVNKYLRRLRVDGAVVPPRGAAVVVDEKEVGAVTSAAAVPDDGYVVALGMVRREVEPPAAVTLRWDGGEASATVLTQES